MPVRGVLPDESQGPDGRSLVELCHVADLGKSVTLEGTACLPEGTVLITVQLRSAVHQHSVTATAGGPERGTWQATIPVEERPARIQVGAVNDGEANVLHSSMLVVAVD